MNEDIRRLLFSIVREGGSLNGAKSIGLKILESGCSLESELENSLTDFLVEASSDNFIKLAFCLFEYDGEVNLQEQLAFVLFFWSKGWLGVDRVVSQLKTIPLNEKHMLDTESEILVDMANLAFEEQEEGINEIEKDDFMVKKLKAMDLDKYIELLKLQW